MFSCSAGNSYFHALKSLLMQEKNDATFTYVFKPILLFFIAYVVNTSLHELSHAITAYAYGIDATLYHYYVNTNAAGPDGAKTVIALVGPLVSLLVGLISLWLYRRADRAGMRLFLLYSGTIGISIFLGNMFSATFGGDMNRVAFLQGFSTAARYLLSFFGLLLSILFMWRMGKEFLLFSSTENHSRIKLIVYTILLPWLGGIVLVALAYWPLPAALVTAMVASSVFWLFTLIGAITAKTSLRPLQRLTAIHWMDLVFFVLAIVVIRLLTFGIYFPS